LQYDENLAEWKRTGPWRYQSEPPLAGGAGLCPRGLAIGELL